MVIFLHSALHDRVRCDNINQLIPSTIANVIISVGVNDECSHVPDTQHDMCNNRRTKKAAVHHLDPQ